MTIKIAVNDKTIECEEGSSVQDIIKQLGAEPSSIAAELDGRVLSKDEFAGNKVKNGSKLELVRFVGGG